MPERKPVLCTPRYQIKRAKEQLKTIFVSMPITRTKKVNVAHEDSWCQFIMTEIKL